jgi:2-polyprenyl-6-methoxyphenol hydroxylase-like FAD-dependent oxidoreductase
VPVGDGDLRARLLDPETFERAGQALVATEPWVDPARAQPITPVHVMAKLLNRQRTFRGIRNFHAVGDAHTCTNPLYGRGCSLAMVHATLLAEAVAAHPDDPDARAEAFEAATAEQIEPWYVASVMADRESRGEVVADESDPRAFMRNVMREGLAPAMRTDQRVLRAFLRTFNLLTTPDALMRDGELITRVIEVYHDRDNRPPEPEVGPRTREEFVALLELI